MTARSARRPLYGWLTADAISLVGTRVSMIALPWFVLTTTGSATKTGLVALAETLPMVLLKVLGGPVIDRLGARRVAISCDLASVVVVGVIPLLHDAGLLSFPLFLALVAVAGALRGPGDAAKHALVPQLVESAGVPMERATGLSSMVERTLCTELRMPFDESFTTESETSDGREACSSSTARNTPSATSMVFAPCTLTTSRARAGLPL